MELSLLRSRRLALVGLALLCTIGTVAVLHVHTDPIVASVPIGSLNVPALFVDEHAKRAFVGTVDDANHRHLNILSTETGTSMGTVPLSTSSAALTIDGRRGRVYVAQTTGATTCITGTCTTIGATIDVLDARTGRRLQSFPVGLTVLALAVDVQTEHLYVVSINAQLSRSASPIQVFDGLTGHLLYTIYVPTLPQSSIMLAIDAQTRRLLVSSMASSTTGMQGAVDVVDLERRVLLQHSVLSSHARIAGSMLVDASRGRVFVPIGMSAYMGRADGIAVIDTWRGTLLRIIATGGEMGSIVEDERSGHVFTTSYGTTRGTLIRGTITQQFPARVGSVLMLDAWSGALLRTLPIGLGTTGVAVDARHGRIFAINVGASDANNNFTQPGMLNVIDEPSGRMLRILPVGVAPVSVALDSQANRLLVVCLGRTDKVTEDSRDWLLGRLRLLLPFLPHHASPSRHVISSVTVFDTSHL